jgi:hypothetical protein
VYHIIPLEPTSQSQGHLARAATHKVLWLNHTRPNRSPLDNIHLCTIQPTPSYFFDINALTLTGNNRSASSLLIFFNATSG